LSHSGFERLIDTSPGYSVGMRFPPARVGARDDGLYRALEEEMLQRRVNLAEQAAPTLLIELVRELNRHFSASWKSNAKIKVAHRANPTAITPSNS